MLPPIKRQATAAKSYPGGRKIISGGESVRDCTNELGSFCKIKINAEIKINVSHWEKSRLPVADTVIYICEEVKPQTWKHPC